jgi:hypothetical protein
MTSLEKGARSGPLCVVRESGFALLKQADDREDRAHQAFAAEQSRGRHLDRLLTALRHALASQEFDEPADDDREGEPRPREHHADADDHRGDVGERQQTSDDGADRKEDRIADALDHGRDAVRLRGGESHLGADAAGRMDERQNRDGRGQGADDAADQFNEKLRGGVGLEHRARLVVVHHVAGVTARHGDDGGDVEGVGRTDVQDAADGEQHDDAEELHRIDAGLSRDDRGQHGGEEDAQHQENRRQNAEARDDRQHESDRDEDQRDHAHPTVAPGRCARIFGGRFLAIFKRAPDECEQRSGAGAHHQGDGGREVPAREGFLHAGPAVGRGGTCQDKARQGRDRRTDEPKDGRVEADQGADADRHGREIERHRDPRHGKGRHGRERAELVAQERQHGGDGQRTEQVERFFAARFAGRQGRGGRLADRVGELELFDVSTSEYPAERRAEQDAGQGDAEDDGEVLADEVARGRVGVDRPDAGDEEPRQGEDQAAGHHRTGRHAGRGDVHFVHVVPTEEPHDRKRQDRDEDRRPRQSARAHGDVGR